MSKTAYQGRKLGEAVDVWENMIKEKDTVIALGFAGSMSQPQGNGQSLTGLSRIGSSTF